MIVFADVETTGLDERDAHAHLLEVALVVTDDDLNEVAHDSTLVQVGDALQLDALIEKLHPVVREMHEKNGLFAELRAGGGLVREVAEERLIAFAQDAVPGLVDLDVCANCKKKQLEHAPAMIGGQGTEFLASWCTDGSSKSFRAKQVSLLSQTPLAGSTIGFDRRWLRAHMPALEGLFLYRSIDVSSINELAKRWAPALYEARPKNEQGAAHRALADVRESISYLKYFREAGFIGSVELENERDRNRELQEAGVRHAELNFRLVAERDAARAEIERLRNKGE